MPLPPADSRLLAEEHAAALTFDYPPGWSIVSWRGASGFTYRVAGISDQRLRIPCFHHGNLFGCGQPLGRLQPAAQPRL